MVKWSPSGLYTSVFLCFMLLWGKLLLKIATRQAYNESQCHLVMLLFSAKAFPTETDARVHVFTVPA